MARSRGVILERKRGECLGLVGGIGLWQIRPSRDFRSSAPLQATTTTAALCWTGRVVAGRQSAIGRRSADREVVVSGPLRLAKFEPDRVAHAGKHPLSLHGVTRRKAKSTDRIAEMRGRWASVTEQADRYRTNFTGAGTGPQARHRPRVDLKSKIVTVMSLGIGAVESRSAPRSSICCWN